MDQQALVDELAARVSAAGFTMAEVCRRAGVAESTPSRWKAGSSGLTLSTLNKLNGSLAALRAERAVATDSADAPRAAAG